MQGGSVTMWEYDFNAFHDTVSDPDDVRKNPQNYIDYTPIESTPEPKKTKTIDERFAELEKAQEATDQAVQDMLVAQLGG